MNVCAAVGGMERSVIIKLQREQRIRYKGNPKKEIRKGKAVPNVFGSGWGRVEAGTGKNIDVCEWVW